MPHIYDYPSDAPADSTHYQKADTATTLTGDHLYTVPTEGYDEVNYNGSKNEPSTYQHRIGDRTLNDGASARRQSNIYLSS